MPAARPRASFEPIPPDFDVRTFVETADNFQYADRISYEMIANNGIEQFEKLVLLHVIIGGKPLVIDGFEQVLDPWPFTPSWLRGNMGDKPENARNLSSKSNIPLTIKHYLKNMSKLTEQFFEDAERYRDKTRQRVYLKDIDCPDVWRKKVKEHIPPGLFYLNESTGEIGGPGALDEPGGRKGRGIGRAGDLMSSLPPEMRAENLMCYIGHEGTYTPAHREMCASLGQNIMVHASTTVGEDGKPERPGSSLWFMTESKDRHLVAEYWLSTLGHDIEVENHFAQLIAWKKAPFKTYVVEQRTGDFILIPPLAPHQVWNRGTRTMKVAWNRTTVETLEMAMDEALPASRIVCRDEQYKNKAIVYYTLLKYSNLIKIARAQSELGGDQEEMIHRSLKIRHVQRDFKRLFDLYKNILLSEMFAPEAQHGREHPELLPFDGNVTCAYCRCNIFNRFLTCKSCKNLYSEDIEEPYDVCMDCYCMGRSCGCQSGYTWVEQWRWKDLMHRYEEWRAQIVEIDGHITEKTPLPLQEERRYFSKKTLAQVCQEQLKIRPFVDIKNPNPANGESEEDEPQIDANGYPKPAKKKSKQWLSKHKSCHVCLHRHPKWKMAFCTNCDYAYCYGTLFRAHDTMPLAIMEDPAWKCPHCKRICNTGKCRSDPRQNSYEPKGTLLGHDTRKVADPRSVECLVDFSVSNLNWVREEDVAMENRRAAAERAKLANPEFDDRYMDLDHDQDRNGITYSPVHENGDFEGHMNGANGSGLPRASDDPWNESSLYPDPDPNAEIPRLGKRNREDEGEENNTSRKKKKNKPKKSKDDTPQRLEPKSTSGKQYQKEVQRKLLEEAKRKDQFILVAARMKGKSKIVKLRLDSDLLEAIQNRPVLERPAPDQERESSDEPEDDTGNILQSDLMAARKPVVTPAQKEKAQKTFRVRVNNDETYSTRKRNPEANLPGKPGRPGQRKSRFEEITIDSEEDDDFVNGYGGPGTGRSTGRTSTWLARKNEGEEDLPTELPEDFRDGLINPNREKNIERNRIRNQQLAERRKSMPSKPTAKVRPPGAGRPRKSTSALPDAIGADEDEDGVGEDDDTGEALLLAQSAAAALEAQRKAEAEKARAAAAEKEAQENLRAKMGIAEVYFGGSDEESLTGFINTLAAEDEPLAHERAESSSSPAANEPPLQSTNSIFSKPGMEGKKIKIVSKRSGDGATKTATTTTVTAPLTGFTAVNKKASKAINVSDSESDSEDEIPAKAPAPKRPVGRPPGRPSLVPTRGTSSGRGRGRPRGRPRKSG
ncbi:hypothetical protein P171DRAFT_434141 [Karstenula rhodostoma CBS 690.94]|uniref:JmjC domain-containing protein n=1 Tax=Karstenula rhodostoma CBS 690.94 TaxID=1392251 RepID=A0A9P4PAI5_9PLEO|nr:hypothetical protein P171DRAFT_434141 [Karstenula rhodostoma CBS 690.94]